MKPPLAATLEPLESRIAPAAVVPYTDIDGDLVRIIDSSDTLTLAQLTLSGGATGQLLALDLTAPGFADANITFSVVRRPGGDGLASVGFIDATGNDLGRVAVRGDLGRIVAGDATTATPGLDALAVRSLGTAGLTTQGGSGTLETIITGTLGTLTVKGSVVEASVTVLGGGLGSAAIGGNLVGGSGVGSGCLSSQGAMGNVAIGGSILGGAGGDSGRLVSTTSIAHVSLGRHLLGGEGQGSGTIDSGGALGRVRIGASLVGGAGDGSGEILATGAAGDLVIAGSLLGGSGTESGALRAASLAGVTIGGDLQGRLGASSGSVASATGAIGNVRIGGDLKGGGGADSGSIDSFSTLGSVRIGGDLIGDTGPSSGRIRSAGDMGNVVIGGDVRGGDADGAGQLLSDNGDLGHVRIGGWLVGGSVSTAATLVDSGVLRASGSIASVSIGGSLLAGVAAGGGTLVRSGAVIAGADLGPVSVGGALLGHSSNPVRIVAGGEFAAALPEDRAIASVTVRGDARYAEILAGFGFDLLPGNADASIGAVRIGGDWIAGSIVAGAEDSPANGYGLGDVLQTATDDPLLTARIAAIAIGGGVRGTAGTAADHFGFVAERIDAVRIGGRLVALTAGASADDVLLGGTDDVRVLEV